MTTGITVLYIEFVVLVYAERIYFFNGLVDIMIHQILLVSPYGPCILDRCYAELKTDPHLIAGFLAAVIPQMEEMGYTLDSLHAEMIGDDNTYMDIQKFNGWICVGIADKVMSRERVTEVLREVGRISYNNFGEPGAIYNISIEHLDETEQNIDLLIAKKGVKTPPRMQGQGEAILPILNHVLIGKMKPKIAAKHLLDSINEENLEKDELDNIKTSLALLDGLISQTSGQRMDDLQVMIRSTHQGVSKITVRADDALSF